MIGLLKKKQGSESKSAGIKYLGNGQKKKKSTGEIGTARRGRFLSAVVLLIFIFLGE